MSDILQRGAERLTVSVGNIYMANTKHDKAVAKRIAADPGIRGFVEFCQSFKPGDPNFAEAHSRLRKWEKGDD